MKKYFTIALLLVTVFCEAQLQPLKISANRRYLATKDGKPFFWLGDTGWLLFKKCTKEEAIKYLDDRKQKGFNVIQVMLLHELDITDAYGDSALINKNVATPNLAAKYNYWNNVDFVIDEAAKRGIYMALVPVWGGNIKKLSVEAAKIYASFLAHRYKNKINIIWLNGGDIKGADALDKWNAIGNTLRAIDKNHLITFHPRGRNSSSAWFHNEKWMDFNMFQSGHRSYAQDTSANETLHYGEDNWKYVNEDYKLKPIRPTFDGEPSYEAIPYGLHKADEPYWQDYEIRRYAYWSVFAGGAGFTYGHNSVMQFYTPGDSGISFFPKQKWQEGLLAPGAMQMQYLKKLLLSRSYFDRVPDQGLINNQGEKYNYLLATKGKNYALVYTYTGRNIIVNLGRYAGKKVKCAWYNPRNGEYIATGNFDNRGTKTFDPPGEEKEGNDWVLVLQGY
jgi:Protein of unknown function (DUF4038)/Putative collagen-binding domain of a collagenase